MAHIDATLRRVRNSSRQISMLTCADLRIDTERHEVYKLESLITLSPTEYEILVCLLQKKGCFISYDELYRQVWQRDSLGDCRALFVHIRHLRQKIEADPSNPRIIRTHRLGGYLIDEP